MPGQPAEGTGHTDGSRLGDSDMGIAGLSVPGGQGMDAGQSHPFSSAGDTRKTVHHTAVMSHIRP